MFFILIGLIIRGVAFEFRGKVENQRWRSLWDWCLFAGSLLPTILFPIAFANLLRGVPIDANMEYVGGFFNLLNPYALLASLTITILIILHGASFLSLKTSGEIEQKTRELVRWLWLLVTLLLVIFLITSFFATDARARLNVFSILFPVIGLAAISAGGYFLRKEQFGRFFATTCLSVAFLVISIFTLLYPRVMVSSLNPNWSLTVQNAASSPYTLKLMTIVTLILLPLVILYQAWTYWVFRKRAR
jgi:cytochrome d ubiquinol oxidase subunit II